MTFFKNEPRWAKWIMLVLGVLSAVKITLDDVAKNGLVEQHFPALAHYIVPTTTVVVFLLQLLTKVKETFFSDAGDQAKARTE